MVRELTRNGGAHCFTAGYRRNPKKSYSCQRHRAEGLWPEPSLILVEDPSPGNWTQMEIKPDHVKEESEGEVWFLDFSSVGFKIKIINGNKIRESVWNAGGREEKTGKKKGKKTENKNSFTIDYFKFLRVSEIKIIIILEKPSVSCITHGTWSGSASR